MCFEREPPWESGIGFRPRLWKYYGKEGLPFRPVAEGFAKTGFGLPRAEEKFRGKRDYRSARRRKNYEEAGLAFNRIPEK